MARPKNPAHREALLAAATRTIAEQGLSASTAVIAKAAGVSTGTLFVHFESKTALVNELYVSLKTEMGRVATAGLSTDVTPREQLRRLWSNWIVWATEEPDRQNALAHLAVAEDITDASHQAVGSAYADIAALLRRITADGPMRDAPLGFVTTLLSAIADATINDLITTPDPTGTRSALAFDAMWRALAG
ncbi:MULTISPECIES: TetR/AcrR family transcriptional regulator [unclassified Curtobacterium]|uniref:TetR/AcrR family transcriptional regulator n=1 Tax=unclassified Curtobacterium TaxID=257496 RepID=UPI00226B86F4|nr:MULTISPECIES: TetR/AcrR family transcriptional regulator [unclassified Curtobacterium]